MNKLVAALAALTTVIALAAPAHADALPSGQRAFGKAPDPVKANPTSWAPIYIPVYPAGSTARSTFSCSHTPVDNCPDHGYLVAGAAQQLSTLMGFGNVYGGGVLGHDHVADAPGGDDFNIAWEPVLVLFTSAAAADEHLVTDAAIRDAQASGDVVLVPAPNLTFNCAVVSAATYARGTPVG